MPGASPGTVVDLMPAGRSVRDDQRVLGASRTAGQQRHLAHGDRHVDRLRRRSRRRPPCRSTSFRSPEIKSGNEPQRLSRPPASRRRPFGGNGRADRLSGRAAGAADRASRLRSRATNSSNKSAFPATMSASSPGAARGNSSRNVRCRTAPARRPRPSGRILRQQCCDRPALPRPWPRRHAGGDIGPAAAQGPLAAAGRAVSTA